MGSTALVTRNHHLDLNTFTSLLGMSEACAMRLFAAGFVDVFDTTVSIERQILALLDRPLLDGGALGGPVIALHVGPLRRDTTFRWRPWAGIDVMNRPDLGEYHRLLAFTAGWQMPAAHAARLVGGVAVADISGFLHGEHAIRVLGYDQVTGPTGRVVRLYGTPLTEDEQALVDGHQVGTGCHPHGTYAWAH